MRRQVLIGEMLVEGGRIDLHQLRSALAWQRRWGGRLGNALLALGWLDERSLATALSRQLGIAQVDLDDLDVPETVVRLVPERIQRERGIMPVALLAESRRGPLLIATSDPLDVVALDEVAFASGKRVRPLLAAPSDIVRAHGRHLDGWRFRVPVDLPPDGIGEWDVDLRDLCAV
jgi:type IV pilus assembly protein PilB